MTDIPDQLKQKLLTVIHDDYEGCEFLTAASQLLVNKIKTLADAIKDDIHEFNQLRDKIGEIGMCISDAEKSLEEAEACYTKLVEILADNKPEKDT